MWMKRRGTAALVLACILAGGGLDVAAQDKDKDKDKEKIKNVYVSQDKIVITGQGAGVGGGIGQGKGHGIGGGQRGGDTFVFVSSEMMIDGKVVKGAPYSAEAVTETTQTLSDGNRIVRKNTAQVYRDGEGRTRREQTFSAIGPFASEGEPAQTVFIHDPVAGVNYILDPRNRTARKIQVHITFMREPKPDGAFGKGPDGPPPPPPPDGKGGQTIKRRGHGTGYVFNAPVPPPHPGGPAPDVMFYSHDDSEPKIESLGTETVEGVKADGKRITHTIPAGAVGNEREINIVNEHWYSPELQTMVMTRHSDPRFGETTFRLTNINRTEPAGTLFQLPSDYTVKEGGPGTRQMRMKRGGPKEEMKFHFEMKPDEN